MAHLRSRGRRPVVLDDLVGLLELPGSDDIAAEAIERRSGTVTTRTSGRI
jgi:hypothetical protein